MATSAPKRPSTQTQFSRRTLLASAALTALAAGSLPAWAQGAPKQIPLRDFFRNPQEAGHQISPDGKFLSWVAPFERRMNVFVRPIVDGKPAGTATRVTSETARSVSGYFWKGDRILYAKDFGGDENFHIVSVNLKGEDLKDLTPGDKVKADIVDSLRDDDNHIILSHNRRDAKLFDVFRVNVQTGKEELIAQNPGNITGWLTDHDGKLRVASTSDGVNTSLLYRANEGDAFKPILTTNFKEGVAPLFFTFDNQRLYVSSNRGRDKSAIFEFDPATAKEGKLIAEHPEVDMSGLTYSRKRKVLTTAPYTTWKNERFFLDKETEGVFKKLQAKLPGYDVGVLSATKDENRYIVGTFSDRTRGKRYLYDVATDKLDLIADISPWLAETDLAEMKPIVYTARDGLKIPGYLTLPKGGPRACRWSSTPMAARGRATNGVSTLKCSSWPTAALRCFNPTSAAPPAMAASSGKPASNNGAWPCKTM
jgi:dipeptidyl aminopeptidase/acylaminoacyl peptidase